MSNNSRIHSSLFGLAFLSALLLGAPQIHAKMQTFEKEYTYNASELDSKSSCRAIALEQVKLLLLQELGVYVQSVFSDKSSSDGKTPDEVRQEITTLVAGVASAEVVEEKWNGETYWLKARIKADPNEVAKSVEALRKDQQKSAELDKERKRAVGLSLELERMRKELDATKSAAAKVEYARKYNDTAQQLRATDWNEKGMAFLNARRFEDAISVFSKAVGLDPKLALAFNNRGVAYINVGDNKRAIEDFKKAIELDPKLSTAYYNRGSSYTNLGGNKRAIEDFNRAIELDPKNAMAFNNRGVAYINVGDNKRAMEDFKKAIELDSKLSTAYYNWFSHSKLVTGILLLIIGLALV
jgi:tetratricopeptide (TPR) repeat protein